MKSDPLFSKLDVMAIVFKDKQKIRGIVENLAASEFEQYDPDTLLERLLKNIAYERPTLTSQEEWHAEERSCQVDVSRDPRRMFIDRSQPFYVAGTELRIFVPFVGNPDYFHIKPTMWSTGGYPRAHIDDGNIVFTFCGENLDGAAIMVEVQGKVVEIDRYLDSTNGTLQNHYSELRPQIRELIRVRVEKLKRAADLGTTLGIPIKKREGVLTAFPISLPKRQRPPSVQHPAAKVGGRPAEPVLAIDEYEYILDVLRNMATVMEQHPPDFESIGEEALRTHFLVQLNGQYPGGATAETFNFGGKTDILLKSEGQNVFVAECKVWKGQASLLKTIDQLLSYLGWRDTKAAILIFNRNRNFTSVLDIIRQAVPTHAGFVESTGEHNETTFNYKFRHPTDPAREMLLAVMAFDLPNEGTAIATSGQ